MSIAQDLLDVLRCPHCVSGDTGRPANDPGQLKSVRNGTWLACQEPDCSRKYPIANGIPAMFIEKGSLWADVDARDLPDPDRLVEDKEPRRDEEQRSFLQSGLAAQLMEALWIRHIEQVPSCEDMRSDPSKMHEFDRHRFPLLSRLAERLITKVSPCTAVDIGVGFGVITAKLRSSGIRVTSLDLSKDYLLNIRQREGHPNLVQGDCANLPFADASFDLVVATDVVEHVPLYGQAMRGCGRIADKGILFSTSLNGLHRVFAQLVGFDVRAWDEDSGHLHIYSYAKLMHLLSANLEGFQLSRPNCLFATPFYLSILTLNYRLPAAWTRPLLHVPNWLASRFPAVFGNWIALCATRPSTRVLDSKVRSP